MARTGTRRFQHRRDHEPDASERHVHVREPGEHQPRGRSTHTWVSGDFATGSTTTGFMARLTWNQGQLSAQHASPMVDTLNVRVTYTANVTSPAANKELKGPGTACLNGVSDCKNPDGAVLNYRGFWATMNTEGAANINGDAFQPYYDTPTSTAAPACPTAQHPGLLRQHQLLQLRDRHGGRLDERVGLHLRPAVLRDTAPVGNRRPLVRRQRTG